MCRGSMKKSMEINEYIIAKNVCVLLSKISDKLHFGFAVVMNIYTCLQRHN